jgi:hypothetical protein
VPEIQEMVEEGLLLVLDAEMLALKSRDTAES